jgi:hypothetical protein
MVKKEVKKRKPPKSLPEKILVPAIVTIFAIFFVILPLVMYLGSTNPPRPWEKCIVASGSGLFCEDYFAYADEGIIILHIKNVINETVNIKIEEVTITLRGGQNCTNSSIGSENKVINFKERVDISISGCSFSYGTKIHGDIDIRYSRGGGPLETTVGEIRTVASNSPEF